MKKILFLLSILILFNCTSSDNGVDTTPTESLVEFAIPLNNGKFWTYKVQVAGSPTLRDSLYIESDVVINGKIYKKFKSRNNVGNGFYTSSIKNNAVREDGNKLLLTGSFSIPISPNLPAPINIDLTDFIIFSKNAANGTQLSTQTGSFNQTINNTPLTFDYTLKSEAGEAFNSFTSPNTLVYNEVKSTKITLTLKITTNQVIAGFPVSVIILPTQDVMVSKQFLAKNKGVVHTNTLTSYNISQQFATQLNIPASSTQTQNEFLDTFN